MGNDEKFTLERKPFNTTINKSDSDKFREYCSQRGIPFNVILEAFMRQFSQGDFKIKIVNNNKGQEKIHMDLED